MKLLNLKSGAFSFREPAKQRKFELRLLFNIQHHVAETLNAPQPSKQGQLLTAGPPSTHADHALNPQNELM